MGSQLHEGWYASRGCIERVLFSTLASADGHSFMYPVTVSYALATATPGPRYFVGTRIGPDGPGPHQKAYIDSHLLGTQL